MWQRSERSHIVRYLDATFRQPDWMLHPMQELIREGDVVLHDELRTWNFDTGRDVEYALFYLEVTDRERYVEELEAVESVREFTITTVESEADVQSFYAYVCQEPREEDLLFRRAFTALNLVVVPPIRYDDEAAMRVTIVGAGEDLQALLENLPDEIETTVHEIGSYDRRRESLANAVTDRQYEAIRAAVACGYYEVPRTGSLEDVAETLECATSTASDHLRKAESAIMRRLVDRHSGCGVSR